MIVYKATFPEGGVYIGATKFPLYERKSRHHYDTRRDSKTYFHKAIRKYGEENVVWEVIHEVETWEQAAALEREEISKARTCGKCYNLLDGGDGLIGTKHSEAWKEHLSQIMKGRKFSEEHRQKISKALIGIKRGVMSEEHREKIRKTMTGQKRTDPVYCKNLSEKVSDYYSKNPKMIFDVFTLEGVFVQRYCKIKDFIRERGGCNTGVFACITGKKKTHHGYIFKRVTDATSPAPETTVGQGGA